MTWAREARDEALGYRALRQRIEELEAALRERAETMHHTGPSRLHWGWDTNTGEWCRQSLADCRHPLCQGAVRLLETPGTMPGSAGGSAPVAGGTAPSGRMEGGA